jgi:MbtH protein
VPTSEQTEKGRGMSEESTQDHVVVINDEEQYSVWPEGREIPPGWRGVGVRGSREECLAHIGEVWTDMRPMSLRRQMDGAA